MFTYNEFVVNIITLLRMLVISKSCKQKEEYRQLIAEQFNDPFWLTFIPLHQEQQSM